MDKSEDAAITAADMAGLTDLSATGAKIRSLTGLEFGANLTVLILNNNGCSDLSPLSGLTRLEALDIGGNPVTDLSPLAGLTKLEFLEIPDCKIVDLSALKGLNHLTNLNLANNQITDLTPLAGLKRLEWIDLSGNRDFRSGAVGKVEKPENALVGGKQRLRFGAPLEIAQSCSVPAEEQRNLGSGAYGGTHEAAKT